MNLSLDKIRTDAGTQSRAQIDQAVIAEYADLIADGVKFPAVTVFYDGAEYFLADGFHRYFATKKAGSPGILCNVEEGTLRDAQLYSYGANHNHGLRRTAADKRKAVISMLEDFEWQEWSDRKIAEICNVSHTFVSAIRKELGAKKTDTKFTRGGKDHKQGEKIKPIKEEEPIADFDEKDVKVETLEAVLQDLKKENEDLQDKLTVAMATSGDDLQKEQAESVIKDLRAQIRLLEIELKAVITSRDQFQAENASLMKQVASLQKKLKKFEDK